MKPAAHHGQVIALYTMAALFAAMLAYGLITGETPGRFPYRRVEEARQYWQAMSLILMLAMACLLGARWLARK